MKFLFLPFTPSLAHITRCLSIAERLKADGHECLFAVGAEGRAFIEKAGFKARILPEISSGAFQKALGWKWLNKKYFQDNLDAELAVIGEFRPNRVIFDFNFTAAAAAKAGNVKSIGIMHGNALSLIFDPGKAAEQIIADDAPSGKTTLRGRFLRAVFPKVFRLILGGAVNGIRPLLKRCGCKPVSLPFELLQGDVNLIADIPEFVPGNIELPGNFHVAGPLMWSGWDRDDGFPVKDLTSRPLVYLTMGSTVEAKTTLLRLINALKGLPYNVVVSKGGLDLGPGVAAENIFIFDYVPGNLVASKSALVVYHGGHETLMQVLAAGVPSLVVPSNPDQILVAKQIKKLGAGDYLQKPGGFPMDRDPLKNMPIEEIKSRITALIADRKIKENCVAMSGAIKQYSNECKYLKYILN